MTLYKEPEEGSLEELQAVRRVLLAARTSLKIDDWVKVWYATASGEHCLIGAVYCGSDATFRIGGLALEAVENALPKRWRNSKHMNPIAEYNDDPTTTKQGVICVLGRAIRSTEAKIATLIQREEPRQC